MRPLPASQAELAGLRCRRWIRESTPGQQDRFGPPSQRALQDRAIAQLGLVECGPEWLVTHSGATVYASQLMDEAVREAQAGGYDVLVVACVERWQRNLRQTLNVLEDELHLAGVCVWFCDEGLLSSNPRDWDRLADEAKAAESWLRKHSRRVADGLAAKRDTKHDPGGRPPYGFRRNAQKLVEADPGRLPTVQRIFEAAANGLSDKEVSLAVGVPFYTVGGMLTSPLYIGQLRDGAEAHWDPVVDVDLWHQVQAVRAGRTRRRGGRPETRRTYALPMLECAHCGRSLVGDKDRYRHLFACEPFLAAGPGGKRRGRLGQSYSRDTYEDLIPAILDRVRLNAADVASVIAASASAATGDVDVAALTRIERDRERAMRDLKDPRDVAAWQARMGRLDAEEDQIRSVEPIQSLSADEIRSYLENLRTWWDDADPDDRQAVAESLFQRWSVLGPDQIVIEATPEAQARGLPAAFGPGINEMVGARGLEPPTSASRTLRASHLRHAPTDERPRRAGS
jgi:DNA invertase Pin-like site-specific DNA recombinase